MNRATIRISMSDNLRPREKLQNKGPAALSDFELLQALIGSGNAQRSVTQIAKDTHKLLKQHRADLTYELLESVKGLGSAKITEILSAFELSRRYISDSEQPIIDSLEKVVEQLTDIRDKKQEYFVCLTLDGANRLIAKRVITIGTLTASLVHPREVFADAISDRAASIIVAHNHPSGNLKQSEADDAVTELLVDTGDLLNIFLRDHVIVTKSSYRSIKT